MNKENFTKYCLSVRELSQSSVNHYYTSLNTITKLLPNIGISDIESIYDIDSYSLLLHIKELLFIDPEFREKDDKGNRMYSAGLNRYLEFAKGVELTEAKMNLLDTKQPVKKKIMKSASNGYNRDRIIVHQVMESEGYKCHIDHTHGSFISATTNQLYMEGHHLIPISVQDKIDYSLDVYSNIVVLCPICHRLLHYGRMSDKKDHLLNLYDNRKERLQDAGIKLGRQEYLDIFDLSLQMTSTF